MVDCFGVRKRSIVALFHETHYAIGTERQSGLAGMEGIRCRLRYDGKTGTAVLRVLLGVQRFGAPKDRGIAKPKDAEMCNCALRSVTM